jgi:hypothetical protein
LGEEALVKTVKYRLLRIVGSSFFGAQLKLARHVSQDGQRLFQPEVTSMLQFA